MKAEFGMGGFIDQLAIEVERILIRLKMVEEQLRILERKCKVDPKEKINGERK